MKDYNESEVRAFRVAYEIATRAGYKGTKAQFAELVRQAGPALFQSGTVVAERHWSRYMDTDHRSARRTREEPYVAQEGARFRSAGRGR